MVGSCAVNVEGTGRGGRNEREILPESRVHDNK